MNKLISAEERFELANSFRSAKIQHLYLLGHSALPKSKSVTLSTKIQLLYILSLLFRIMFMGKLPGDNGWKLQEAKGNLCVQNQHCAKVHFCTTSNCNSPSASKFSKF